jgi:ferrous iron transport protein B
VRMWPKELKYSNMKELRVAVVGQPNVGKSCLLNALASSRIVVSNYPGTTVELTRAKKVIGDTRIYFEDTPGIYSISDRSEEEKVTEKAIFEEKVDRAVVIADSTSLDRSLYLALQILEARIPTIIALNFIEDAQKKGITIDYEKLQRLLGIPIVPINPLTKKGISRLLDAIVNFEGGAADSFNVEYDDDIEEAINRLSPCLSGTALPKRFVALRILEEDEDFEKYLEDKGMIKQVKQDMDKHHPRVYEDIAITRYRTACFIVEKVTQIVPLEKDGKKLQDKVDGILLDNTWGLIASVLSLLFIFGVLLYLGNLIQGSLMGWVESLQSYLGTAETSIVNMVLVQGITGVAAGVSIALPYVFLFYIILALLEDSGILSRFTVNVDRFLATFGLPAKAFIPLALGLGCTAPATTATRVVSSKKEQFHTASFFAFVPCSSRIAIIMGVVGYFGGIGLAFSVFFTLLIAGLLWALVIKKVSHAKGEPLLLELPPYRKPAVKNVVIKSWIRMREFVYIVIPFLIIGGIVYGILDTLGLTNAVVEPFSPITAWLGLPSVAIIPLIFGFLQKDLTGAMLLSVIGTEVSSVLTPIQIYTFGLAATIGIPCIIALGMIIREFGFRKAILLTVSSVFYGLLLAGFIWRVISIF